MSPMSRWHVRGVIVLCLIATAVAAADVPPRLELTLADVRQQSLPARVYDVHVGPDDRAWYVLRPAFVVDRATSKRRIEAEFAKADPQVDLPPALFEPGGRVWFLADEFDPANTALLGYDGRRWVERSVSKMDAGPEHVGHARRAYRPCNAFVAGRAWFPVEGGVLVHDDAVAADGGWALDKMRGVGRGGRAPGAPMTLPEPDGKGLVAWFCEAPAAAMRWRDGAWAELPIPPRARDLRLETVVPQGGRGVWMHFAQERYLAFVEYDPAARPDPQRLFAALGADAYAARERAQRDLAELGPAVAPLIAKARATAEAANDAEVLHRLDRLTHRLNNPDPDAPAYPPARVAGRELSDVRFVVTDTFGHVAIGGQVREEGADKPGPGVLLLGPDPAAAPQLLAGAATLDAWVGEQVTRTIHDYTIVPVGQGKAAWTVGDRVTVPRQLIDLATGGTRAALPSPLLFYPLAARADGTLFATPTEPRTGMGGAVVAYRPGAARDNVVRLPVASSTPALRFAVATDGAVWAVADETKVVRFDGRAWTTVPGLNPRGEFAHLIPGNGGAMLLGRSGQWALWTPGANVAPPQTAPLEALIRQHRAAFVKAFANVPGGTKAGFGNAMFVFQVDRDDNVWLIDHDDRQRGRARVLAGDRWIDLDAPLRAAGHENGVDCLAALGDGRVYVAGCQLLHQGGHAHFARVAADKQSVTYADAPKCDSDRRLTRAVGDGRGGLWLPAASLRKTDDALGWTVDYAATPVDATGRAGAGIPDAYPVFRDRGGNVWLNSHRADDRGDPFRVWRDGRVTCEVEIPDADERTRLFATRKGAVFAWTTTGLLRLVEDPARPGHFAPDGLAYATPEAFDPYRPAACSALGYLAVHVTRETPSGSRDTLYLYKLPE